MKKTGTPLFQLDCTVNGRKISLVINPGKTLSEFLREDLLLTGTKTACNQGECGACMVVVDGKAVNSCLFMAAQAQGCKILTVEGLKGSDGGPHPLVRAFAEEGAVQCGFCTPGMLMTSYALLQKNPSPTRDEIKAALAGNICRCTGYEMIFNAVEKASALLRGGK